ncbi:hypothetical protein CDL15_Pgr000642 [Punica granatum]|uniref:Uncharacterized protein n=1 Tax=Punica granatum TaxID=22663 RepID=A0A218W4F7_PUNGR|nr:hypothetical protein CDL15_Pgr000642 [Punica granatum]
MSKFPASDLFRNLSGLNSSGLSQWVGSRPRAHTLTNTRAPAGISQPSILQSSVDSLTTRGALGWSLRVSFTMAWRYGRFGMSASDNNLFLPKTESISS